MVLLARFRAQLGPERVTGFAEALVQTLHATVDAYIDISVADGAIGSQQTDADGVEWYSSIMAFCLCLLEILFYVRFVSYGFFLFMFVYVYLKFFFAFVLSSMVFFCYCLSVFCLKFFFAFVLSPIVYGFFVLFLVCLKFFFAFVVLSAIAQPPL